MYADSGSAVLMSGMLAWSNSAAKGGVLYCVECSIVGTQLDSVRAIDCQGDGLPTLAPSRIQESVVGKQPDELLRLHEKYNGQLVSVFANNTASDKGGALHCKDCGMVVLRELAIVSN